MISTKFINSIIKAYLIKMHQNFISFFPCHPQYNFLHFYFSFQQAYFMFQFIHSKLKQIYISDIMKHILLIILAIFFVNALVSVILSQLTTYYNPNIKATYSGFDAALLGIFLVILTLNFSKFNYSPKFITSVLVLVPILSVLGIIFQFALGFYLGGWACIMWLLLSIMMIYCKKIQFFEKKAINQVEDPHANGYGLTLISSEQNASIQQNPEIKVEKPCCSKQKCGYCCHACCLVTNLLLMTLFVIFSIIYFANLSQYPVYGQTLKFTNEEGQSYSFHAYCIGDEQATRPTIVLQHGGGSNSIAFAELGYKLAERHWKMCAYDRLGYGRSSVIHRGLSVQKRAQLTNYVITKLLQNHSNKKVIIGGWSAGVQISQVYRKLYPSNIHGMIFLDGYPDYMRLMSIYDNKTQAIEASPAGITGIVRVLEPFGLGLIVGSNKISNQTLNGYYKGYYQTGYFWESQYFDVVNPYSLTKWLTVSAGSDTKPYPESQIDLNWPDIDVPLLVMPANGTVTNGAYSKMYLQQSQKYLDKCTNSNKNMIIMKGDHGFVLEDPEEVSKQIDFLFNPLF